MENKLILWLTLMVGSLFSQEPQQWCFMTPELQKVLAPSPDQCSRIGLAYDAFWQEAEPLFDKIESVQHRLENIVWGDGIGVSDEQAGEEAKKAIIEQRKLLGLLREIESKRSRAVLNVLDQRQRQTIDTLIKMAPTVHIFSDAVSAGLIPAEIAYPRSGMKGLAESRRRASAVR